MQLKVSGKPVNITCNEHSFPEFPNLLFGKIEKSTFFDASLYLQTIHSEFSVDDFMLQCEPFILKLLSSYNMESEQTFILNQDGHILIDGTFSYLFLSFVEPDFLAYVFDRIHEVFANGFAVSDTYLLHHASRRLSKELLNMIINGKDQ